MSMPKSYPIRTANKAIIRDDAGRLLVGVFQDRETGAIIYLLPGGGQEWGEDRVTALRRECQEEVGCDVVVDGLACLRTYVADHHRFADIDTGFHQEEALWFCHLAEEAEPGAGTELDSWQIGFAWKTLTELRAPIPAGFGRFSATTSFSPEPLLDWLEADPVTRPLYLGDCM